MAARGAGAESGGRGRRGRPPAIRGPNDAPAAPSSPARSDLGVCGTTCPATCPARQGKPTALSDACCPTWGPSGSSRPFKNLTTGISALGSDQLRGGMGRRACSLASERRLRAPADCGWQGRLRATSCCHRPPPAPHPHLLARSSLRCSWSTCLPAAAAAARGAVPGPGLVALSSASAAAPAPPFLSSRLAASSSLLNCAAGKGQAAARGWEC